MRRPRPGGTLAPLTLGDLLKSIAALLGFVLLAATLTAPAAAAEPADPTNVQISWKDGTFKFIHVTWEEAGPQPNAVFVRVVGKPDRYRIGYVGADAPNEFDMRSELLYSSNGIKEIGVVAGTAAGDLSQVAVSPAFDTIVPLPAKLDSFTMSGTSSLHVKWFTGAPISTDTTPNDPLDQPATVLSLPRYSTGAGTTPVDLAKAGTATELAFTGPTPPFMFYVSATNEWMTSGSGANVYARANDLKVTIPTWIVYGNEAAIMGSVYPTPITRSLVLQARNSPTSPWYVVSNEYTAGAIYFRLFPGAGTRQYRVAVANYASGQVAYFGGYSAPVTTTVQQKARATPQSSAGHVFLGLTTPVYLDVQPAVTGKAVLQRWNGKAWTTVGNVPLKNGFGTGNIRGAALGRVAYRYYVPTHTWRGLPVAATYSQQFVITTIR
jgi:hypothetical protein